MLTSVSSVVEAQKRLEEAPLEWPLRILAFFVSTVLLGIPVLLAHRHCVEKGAKRKARQWGRWALAGFVFYVMVASALKFVS